MNEGWHWPVSSRKAHYFRKGISLCKRWLFCGPLVGSQETGTEPGPDDCHECHRRLMKERSEVK